MIVLDSSVVLAILLKEPGREVLDGVVEELALSTVNLGEVVTKLVGFGHSPDVISRVVAPFRNWCRPLTEAQAMQAGLWRGVTKKLGLSLGDRCCLALAHDLGAAVYTTDRAWAGLDLGVTVHLIR